jgi:hypothetical protein
MKMASWGLEGLVLLLVVGGVGTCVGTDEQAGRAVVGVEVKPLVAGPSDASQWEAWREGLCVERRRVRERLGYDGGAQEADFAAEFLLMWPGLDRCATIGFRCVVDLADPLAAVE